jgi:hypothetical protein
MVAETAQVKPSNKIVVDSRNLRSQSKKVESATNMYPGRLVIKGTNDDDISVAGSAGAALGWLGYEQSAKLNRPATVDTIYTVGVQAALINGPGMIIVGSLVSGQTANKGARLMTAAGGELSGGTVGTHEIVAIAEETKVSTTNSRDIIVRSLI